MRLPAKLRKIAGVLTLAFSAACFGGCSALAKKDPVARGPSIDGIYACADHAGEHVTFDTTKIKIHKTFYARWITVTNLDNGKKKRLYETSGWHCHLVKVKQLHETRPRIGMN